MSSKGQGQSRTLLFQKRICNVDYSLLDREHGLGCCYSKRERLILTFLFQNKNVIKCPCPLGSTFVKWLIISKANFSTLKLAFPYFSVANKV